MKSALALCLAVVVSLAVESPTITLAQPIAAQPGHFSGESDSISVAGRVLEPRPLLEVALVLRNKSSSTLHLDPSLFAVVSDQGEQFGPLAPEQERSRADSPSQSGWGDVWLSAASYFGLWWLGFAVSGLQDATRKQIDARSLSVTDVPPGATVKGSLFFKSFTSKTNRFTLLIDGIMQESGEKLAAIRLSCELPRSAIAPGQTAPDNSDRH